MGHSIKNTKTETKMLLREATIASHICASSYFIVHLLEVRSNVGAVVEEARVNGVANVRARIAHAPFNTESTHRARSIIQKNLSLFFIKKNKSIAKSKNKKN